MLPLEEFKAFIERHQLFSADERVLLAVSGGKDSVLMARLFKLAGFKFSIAHCNFNLRADEAQRDEAFVKLLAMEMEVPFHHISFETKQYAKEHRISTQMAARSLRYHWFDQLCETLHYSWIAVAHHQTDVVETMLLNLTRGTGISGLHGISAKRDRLIRPLLFLDRERIDAVVAESDISFVEDSSNQSDVYARNNIRLNVLPHLKAINPQIERTFSENAERFAETEALLKNTVDALKKTFFTTNGNLVLIRIDAVEQLNPKKLLFYELLRPFHFSSDVCNEILESLNKQSGTSFYSETHRITVDRDELVLTDRAANQGHEMLVIHQNDTDVSFLGRKLSFNYQERSVFTPDPKKAYVDFHQLIFPLICRTRHEGDRFMPLGMKNFKLLSDFLIGQKVPLPQKETIPILINGNGEIIWIAGMRQDERYKVTASTKKVVIFELSN